ncbi:hypothetical protein D3C86_2064690 [compost metagenome]
MLSFTGTLGVQDAGIVFAGLYINALALPFPEDALDGVADYLTENTAIFLSTSVSRPVGEIVAARIGALSAPARGQT